MKKIVLISLLFTFVYTSYGQPHKMHGSINKETTTQKKLAHQQFLDHLLPTLSKTTKAAMRTTSIEERLVAQSEYSHVVFTGIDTGLIQDSAKYGYSGGRPSNFSYNFMEYYNTYELDGSTIFSFGSSVGFLDHNDNPGVLSDTTEIYKLLAFTDSLVLYDTRYATYDTNDNIDNYADVYPDSGIYSNNRYVNTFDSYTNIATSLALSEDFTFVWDTSELRLFIYNGAHQLIEDSTSSYYAGTWTPLEKWLYSYDGSGNMLLAIYQTCDITGTIWSEQERYVMTYYTDNKIYTVAEYADSSYGLVAMYTDTFTYTTGISYATFAIENAYTDSGALDTRVLVTKHVATGGLPDTVYTSEFDIYGLYIAKGFTTYSYDSYNEPLTARAYPFVFDSTMVTGAYDSTYNDIIHYYYQTYESEHSTTSVQQVPTAANNIKVYPIPTTDAVNIVMPNATTGAYTFIKLVNASGQVVHTESQPWMNETEQISMAGLIPGVYWLIVEDKGGNSLYRQQIIKL